MSSALYFLTSSCVISLLQLVLHAVPPPNRGPTQMSSVNTTITVNNKTLSSSSGFVSVDILSMSELSELKRVVLHFVLIGITIVTAIANTVLALAVSRKIQRPQTIDEEVPEPVKIYAAGLNRNIWVLVGLQICLMFSSSAFRSKRCKENRTGRKGDGAGHDFMCFFFIFITMLFQAWNLWRFSRKYAPPRDEAIELNDYPSPVAPVVPEDDQVCRQEQSVPAPPYAAHVRQPV
ncbi:hypothetical protein FPOAC2_04682 [Fusarium poae]|uniref:Uncharacterized protein n=1 Tax=Fusarium poae TaxID=36050 RepID=A0A1B8ASS8_FUSPO|nr:hypothetical protein FPOAC1_004592 [Fusarium poae]KAG8671345.1 hypothetical protein FPOAC1_004592 [Fusarium poae]OBS23595.1 hypothetical protein FPOA_04145 [Fusarium poae]